MIENGRARNRADARDVLRRDGVTLHHNEDGRTLQEVPTVIHKRSRHLGGSAVIKTLREG